MTTPQDTPEHTPHTHTDPCTCATLTAAAPDVHTPQCAISARPSNGTKASHVDSMDTGDCSQATSTNAHGSSAMFGDVDLPQLLPKIIEVCTRACTCVRSIYVHSEPTWHVTVLRTHYRDATHSVFH